MMNELKILFVNLTSNTSDMYVASAPPLGLYRIKNYLASKDIICDIVDLDLDGNLESKYLQMVEQGKYDVIGISVSHHNMITDLQTLWKFRNASKKSKKKCLFISGGQEATLNYQQWLEAGIDIIILGFAEKPLYELILRMKNSDGDLNNIKASIKDIEGIAYKTQDGSFIYNSSTILTPLEWRELSFNQILQLSLPYKDYWNVMYKDAGNLNFHGNKFIVETVRLYTTSHCPQNCGFCSSQSFIPCSQKKISKIFMLSADEVFKLIQYHIRKYGAKGFLFSDDDLPVGNREGLNRISDLCRLIINAKNNDLIPKETIFNCQARITDFIMRESGQKKINSKLIALLAQARFHGIGLGVETFSSRLLKCPSINKIGINEEDCCNVLDAILQDGLIPTINIIIGIPEITCDEIINTMRVAVKYLQKGCQVAVTTYMLAFPGAPIYNSSSYHIHTNEWINPETKKKLLITDYIIPNDPTMADMLSKVKDATYKEIQKIKKENPWLEVAMPKSLTGLIIFVSVAKLLGRRDVAEEFLSVAHQIIQEEAIQNVEVRSCN